MLALNKRVDVMLSLRPGQGLAVDQLLQPLSQPHQLFLSFGHCRSRFGLESLAILGQHLRIDAIGFRPLATSLGCRSHLGRIGDRDRDLLLVQRFDQGLFVAAGGFTNDVNARGFLQLHAQLTQAAGRIFELALAALQMNLQIGLGNINTGINNRALGGHSFVRVLTHPYIYELTVPTAALATVRAWSTGRARLWLGYGLAKDRPRLIILRWLCVTMA